MSVAFSTTDGVTTEPEPSAARESSRFHGKVAIITGASDKGIGGAIAERLAREGAAVYLTSLLEPKRLLKRLQRIGCRAQFVPGDIRNRNDVRTLVDACLGQFGQIDILINNAGIESAKSLAEFAEDRWREIVEVNLMGAISVSQCAAPRMAETGGVIVNVASALGLAGCGGFAAYSASKAGLIGFTQSLAWELAPRRIRVVAVAPGLVHTPMIHKHIEHLTADTKRQIEACHPLGIGLPHDVASAVAFLASDDARWITGVTLPLGWAPHYPLPTQQFMMSE